jgi:hypothetical protein
VPDRRVGLGQIDAPVLREPARANRRWPHRVLGEEIKGPKVDANQVRRRIGIVFQASTSFRT